MAPRRNHNNNSSIVQHHHLQHQQQSLLITTTGSTTFHHDLEQEQQQQHHFHQHQQQQSNLLDNDISLSPSINNNNNNNTMSPMHTSCNNTGNTNGIITSSNATINNNNEQQQQQQQYTRCCYPNGDCLKIDALIFLNDLNDCIRVLCNNENCNVGQYMHRECFESWEQTVLNTLKSIGRARSWSERQRSQNLWTKKGYDLVYKACGCNCGRGHLRKDLEWTPASAMKNALHYVNGNGGNVIGGTTNGQRVALSNGNAIVNGNNNNNNSNNINNNNIDDDDKKKKKKRNRNNQVKTTVPLTPLQQQNGYANNQQQGQPQQQQSQQNMQSTPQQNCQNNTITTQLISNSNNNQSNNSNSINSNNLEIMPNPNVGVIGSGLHNNNNNNSNNNNVNQQNNANQQQQQQQKQNIVTLNNILNGNNATIANNILGLDLRARAGSLSSSGAGSGSTSPAASQSSIDISISPIHKHQQQHIQQLQQFDQQITLQQQQLNSFSKRLLNGISTNLLVQQPQALQSAQQHQQQQQQISNSLKQLSAFDQQQLILQQKVKEVEVYSERVRSTSGCNGIFSRRLDFSSFNLLPKTRLNSYQVKIEDEGNHGNDETRLFILSSLAQSQRSRVACILCEEPMLVFDRYPLVDGSFFLSPKQHSSGCIEVKYEGRTLYLTCVCMSCLDGSSCNRVISCRFCAEIWDGSNLVLGTMYAYDIFAAMPCCAERLKCNNCFKLLLHPQQRLSFYSDYSHCVTCPYCATQDTHFVKPLTYCFTKSTAGRLQSIA